MIKPTRTPTSSRSKPASLSSSRLQQEALESALHGVNVHPVWRERARERQREREEEMEGERDKENK
jgi:hypothetical protein